MSSSPARGTRSVRAGLVAVVAVLVGGVVAAIVQTGPAGAGLPAPRPCDPAFAALPLATPVTDAFVSTTGLAGAPAYYEFSLPVAPHTFTPKGYLLVVHGGGWQEHGPGKVEQLRPEALAWRQRGWATLNVTYRPCGQSIADVFEFYRLLRAAAGPEAPICATGASAGGHLVLLLAMFFPDLDCAISQAGPIDLVNVPAQLAFPDRPEGPNYVYQVAAGAFGVLPELAFASPQTWVPRLGVTRLLVATAVSDPLIPLVQGRNLRISVQAIHPGHWIEVVELAPPAPGSAGVPFVHGTVSIEALGAYRAAEDALVAPLLAG